MYQYDEPRLISTKMNAKEQISFWGKETPSLTILTNEIFIFAGFWAPAFLQEPLIKIKL